MTFGKVDPGYDGLDALLRRTEQSRGQSPAPTNHKIKQRDCTAATSNGIADRLGLLRLGRSGLRGSRR